MATDALRSRLRPGRVAEVVRRPAPALQGRSLLQLALAHRHTDVRKAVERCSTYGECNQSVDNRVEERLAAVVATVQRIVEESGDPNGFDADAWTREWVHEPLRTLGARPIDLLQKDEGMDEVLRLLRQMQAGTYR